MVYEHVIHRRHYSMVYNDERFRKQKTGSTIILVDLIPLIHRTFHLLHTEATSFFEPLLDTSLALRLLLDPGSGTGQVLNGFLELISDFDDKDGLSKQEGYRNFIVRDDDLKNVTLEPVDISVTRDHTIIHRFTFRALDYRSPRGFKLYLGRPTSRHRLQIAVCNATTNTKDCARFREPIVHHFNIYHIRARIYTTKANSAIEITTIPQFAKYCGVIDKNTWEKDWMANC